MAENQSFEYPGFEITQEVVAQLRLEGNPPYGSEAWGRLAERADALRERYIDMAAVAQRFAAEARRTAVQLMLEEEP